MELESLITKSGLPGSFGGVLLALALVLTLAPYLAGHDFGFFKVPTFSENARRRLKWLGPAILILMIVVHLPLLAPSHPVGPNSSPAKLDEPPRREPTPPDNVPDDSPPIAQPGRSGTSPGSGQNHVQVSIVSSIDKSAPLMAQPLQSLTERGQVVLTGRVVVESRTSDIVPFKYLLEWVLITGDQELHLSSYRDNEEYKFAQRVDVQRTFYWVEKTIWTDNRGTYVFRVYCDDENGTITLQGFAELSVT